jgi:hypothetical protein
MGAAAFTIFVVLWFGTVVCTDGCAIKAGSFSAAPMTVDAGRGCGTTGAAGAGCCTRDLGRYSSSDVNPVVHS